MMNAVDHLPFEARKLATLADVIVNTGVNVQPGQELIISAPIEALPLVRQVAASAYKAGASLVTPFYTDDEPLRARQLHATD